MKGKPVFYLAASFFLLCLPVEAGESYGPLSGHTIRVDGSITDWVGIPPAKPNTGVISKGEFIWNDAVDDDTGNGKYTYPENPAFAKAADLVEFRITWDAVNVYFLIKTAMPGDPRSGYRIIAIDTGSAGGSRRGVSIIQQGNVNSMNPDTGTFGNLRVSESLSVDYVIAVAGTNKGRIWDGKGSLVAKTVGEKADTQDFQIKDANICIVTVQVPQRIIGNPAGKIWRFIVASGLEDNGHARAVYKNGDEWHGGGGAANGSNPSFYDLISPDKRTQEMELSGYNPNAARGDPSGFAEIKNSYIQIKFAPYPQMTGSR